MAELTIEQIKEDYKNSLDQVIANDPITGPLHREREELRKVVAPSLSRISDINNIINNTDSKEVQAALKALRAIR